MAPLPDDLVSPGLRALLAVGWTAVVFLLLAALAVFLNSGRPISEYVALAFVAAFSGLVGYAELAQRYRDDPVRLFAHGPAVVYVCVNVAAGIAAFALVEEFDVFHDTAHRQVWRVLLAGFGAVAFFRSSLFTARVGDTSVDVGPATLLKSLLDATDRLINRAQAGDRAADAASIMRGVSFDKVRAALPALCMNAVENLTPDEQKGIADQVDGVAAAKYMSDQQRSVVLGAYLIRMVGPVVLQRAVDALGSTVA